MKRFFIAMLCFLTVSGLYSSARSAAEMLEQTGQSRVAIARQAFNLEVQRQESDITDAQKQKAYQLREELLTNLSPTKDRCRPAIREKGGKAVFSRDSLVTGIRGIVDDLLGGIVCMLAGYKFVFLGYLSEFNDLSQELKDLLRLEGFDYLIVSYLGAPYLLVFSPRGQQAALVLSKEMFNNELSGNVYIEGWLLGYFPQDIEAYYQLSLVTRDVQADKQQALDWILKHKPNIQEWVAEHIDPATKTLKNDCVSSD